LALTDVDDGKTVVRLAVILGAIATCSQEV
jgi:hypothetical protein